MNDLAFRSFNFAVRAGLSIAGVLFAVFPVLAVAEDHSVVSVAFSHDGQRLASSGQYNKVSVWNPSTGEELFALSGHTDEVLSVAFSPDDKTIVSGGRDSTIRLWDPINKRQVFCITTRHKAVNSVAFSNDGAILVAGSSDGTVSLWNAKSGAHRRDLVGHANEVTCVAINNSLLVAGSEDGSICFFDLPSGRLLRRLQAHQSKVTSLSFSPRGGVIASGSMDGSLKLWRCTTGDALQTIRTFNGKLQALTFSPDGRYLLTGTANDSLKLWNLATGQEFRNLQSYSVSAVVHHGRVRQPGPTDVPTIRDGEPFWNDFVNDLSTVAFNKSGTLIAVGGFCHTVRIFDSNTGRLLRSLGGHARAILSICYSPNGNNIASAAGDGTIILWDAKTGRELLSFQPEDDIGSVGSIVFSRDGKYLYVSGDARNHTEPYMRKTISTWDLQSIRCIASKNANSHNLGMIARSPDGKLLASGCDLNAIGMWEVQGLREYKKLIGHLNFPCSVAFASDAFLASGAYDCSIRLWDVSSGKMLYVWPTDGIAVKALAASPDGTLLASGGYDVDGPSKKSTVQLWNISTHANIRTFDGPYGSFCVAFSRDSKLLASSCWDQSVSIWDVASGARLDNIKATANRCVNFSPDGSTLALDDAVHMLRYSLEEKKFLPSFAEGVK